MLIPGMILKYHVVSFWAFLTWVLIESVTDHSGYDFFAQKAKMHDLHHEKFMVNFGIIGLLDWVHGTDKLASEKK
jgi:methylsterol monooxygenase